MPTRLNDHFTENMTGKHIKFEMQPYSRGEGVITKITAREVKTKEFLMGKGRVDMTYEVFDVEVLVETGTHIGGFYAGVPISKPRDIKGETKLLPGRTFSEVYNACEKGQTMIIAYCG